ncbi:MAG: RNA polymerase sigma-70 factor [Saprospiraceae bacterium]|nr:RNA polymerase sigma-70 factor [Saprospiraceae bacterium]MCB9342073.1 RNA polymerase sigma-70 factor [Lewinellaceae bacterium]
MEELPENIWLSGLRNGDENALRSIFDKYYSHLIGVIYRMIPDVDTCQDLAQEVFVELWNKRETINIQSSLQAYLRRAAINRALNHIKTQKRTILEDAEKFGDKEDITEQELGIQVKKENQEKALHNAIDALPERCRIVFTLSRFENMSHKEIAEKLGISVKTIENQITKAMKLLRQALV